MTLVYWGRHGVPQQTCPDGMSLKTLLRAPITALTPILTPGPTKQSVAIHAPLPTVMTCCFQSKGWLVDVVDYQYTSNFSVKLRSVRRC